ncbi:MAG: alpha/beta hydrolase fold domain-containing protein [Bacteroidia bacterium]
MNKIYFLMAAGILSMGTASAQCPGNRYHDFSFPITPIKTTNVTYGSNIKETGSPQTLLMDVYQPAADTATMPRALVIVAHGGSFIGGTKTGSDVVPLCNDLAKLGYVSASIEYRLGMNNFPFPGPDSADATAAVMRAVQDGRAAVRYFRKNARVGGNTYKIDTNNIFFMGVSAGGFIALQLAYLDQMSEFPTYVDTTQPGLSGGLEGISGNPGYSSDVKAIVNICGALGDTAWMHAGDEPVMSFHGTADQTVPYNSDTIVLSGFYPLLVVDGSWTVHQRANAVGIENCFETFEGADHTPEIAGGTAATQAAYYDTIITETRNFLEHQVCGVPLICTKNTSPILGVHEIAADAEFNVYPNPSRSEATVDLAAFKGNPVNIVLFDAMGRQVKNVMDIRTDKYTLTRDQLPSGIYFMNILCDGKLYSKKVMFE